MAESITLIIFFAFIILMLFLDLGVFHKKDHEIQFKEALIWTIVWIFLALLFYVFIYFRGAHSWHRRYGNAPINKKHHHRLNFDGMSFQEAIQLYRKTLLSTFPVT